MNRHTGMVAVASAGLGIVIGGVAVYLSRIAVPAVFKDATRPPLSDRAVLFGEQQFDGKGVHSEIVFRPECAYLFLHLEVVAPAA
jgi:hypothetical protein